MHGIAVRFYKRRSSEFYTFDFGRGKERIQRVSDYTTVKEAEWQAAKQVKAWVDGRSGKTAAERELLVQRGRVATVGEVIALLEDARLWKEGTVRTYKSALLSLARTVNEEQPFKVGLDVLLTRATIERFYAQRQGLKAANWVDILPANGGANATVRNVKSLFRARAVDLHMQALKLPDLTALRGAHFLKAPPSEFVPWPEDVYAEMEAASQVLKTEKPELWLVNAMLRRLGLRDEELLEARREWIEVQGSRAWLVVANRGTEFTLLKNGAQRRLELDSELQEILLPRTGYLIADGWKPWPRKDLIYRTHSQWMRTFVGDEAAKTNHQLRKYAASKIYSTHGLVAAAEFLGDTVATVEKYYKAYLGASPLLDGAAVAQARML
jgi:hypothetical protein